MCALKQPIDDLKSLKSKMRTNPYHFNLLSDAERITSFKEAIQEKARGIVFDIGSGCGILSIFASYYSDYIYSVEIDPNTAKLADFNFKDFSNINLINKDARDVVFENEADLIICEMLDTALIDEEQVPVINSILKYLKDDGEVIPCKIFNGAEIISMDRDYICYEDAEANQNPNYDILSNFVVYNEINFKNTIKEDLEVNIEFKILKKGILSGIKITTFTLLTEDIICGPTPMLNPPILVPIEKLNVNIGDKIKINLSYRMGGGLNTIKTRIKRIS